MKFSYQLIVAAIFVAGLGSCQQQKSKSGSGEDNKAPNIIFIMADDHAYQALSAYSDKLIETPNIDRIAEHGMLFSNACVTNSICAPSRAVILTGKHSHINGKIDNRFPFDTTQITFPQIFQKAGYQTAMFGKLHFGNNPKGIDQFKILPGQGRYYNPEFITNDGKIQVEGYATEIITDMTLDWLKNQRQADKPFLLFFLHKAPHREWNPEEKYYTEFINRTFPEPANLFDDYQNRGSAAKEAEMNILKNQNWAGDSKIYPEVMDELGIKPTSNWDKRALENVFNIMTDEQKAAWDKVYKPMNEDFKKKYPDMDSTALMKWRYQRYMQDYLASIMSVDDGVGRLLDYLEESGLDENTMVVYTSDQGFYLGEHGWFDKRFIYEESFKTPLLIQWPEVVEPGSVCDEMVQNLDFAETFLDAAGLEVPDDMQGESIIPLLKGENDKWTRNEVYYHYYEYPAVHMVKRHYGIVTKKYKLAHFYYDVDEWELYDRIKDPMEMNNVYDDPNYADVRADLLVRLEELRKKYKDSKELDQYFIDKYKEAGIIKE